MVSVIVSIFFNVELLDIIMENEIQQTKNLLIV